MFGRLTIADARQIFGVDCDRNNTKMETYGRSHRLVRGLSEFVDEVSLSAFFLSLAERSPCPGVRGNVQWPPRCVVPLNQSDIHY